MVLLHTSKKENIYFIVNKKKNERGMIEMFTSAILGGIGLTLVYVWYHTFGTFMNSLSSERVNKICGVISLISLITIVAITCYLR